MESKSYNGLDILKFICCLLIIPIHINSIPRDAGWRVLYYFSKAIGNIGVPCFFMISGFLFFKKHFTIEDRKEQNIHLLNYIKRISIMLFFWMIIYFVVSDFWWIKDGNIGLNCLQYLKNILFGGPGFFLWYLVALIVGMIICYFVSKLRLNIGIVIAGICLVLGVFLTETYSFFFAEYSGVHGFIARFKEIFYTARNGVFWGFPCVFIGMALSKKRVLSLKLSILLACVAGLLFLIEFGVVCIVLGKMFGVMQLSALILAFSLVMLFLNLRIEKKYYKLRKLSFLIYVIHPLCIRLIPIILSVNNKLEYYWYFLWYIQIPIIVIVSILIGLGIIWLSKKYSFFKKIM